MNPKLEADVIRLNSDVCLALYDENANHLVLDSVVWLQLSVLGPYSP